MSLTCKVLLALALAIALAPFAAQAHSAAVPLMRPSPATIGHPTAIYSGVEFFP
ncbi:MAG TPA: hypothetical protein VNC39_10675 [Acidocella sp.]|jgi:hypothetical protein|uniref:hypothetical protein n=1 Tax=Acidocella sp. TaxID=50710 RepID=UPI002B73E814|nr:hypothetical protein [Acidocella sp.]HVE22433.1 hypothetical protein [Acidocella sp.]